MNSSQTASTKRDSRLEQTISTSMVVAPLVLVIALVMCVSLPPSVQAQSLSDRIKDYQARRQNEQKKREAREALQRQRIASRMAAVVAEVQLDQTPLRTAIRWWSNVVGVSVEMPWRALEQQGIDADDPITISLKNVPASALLSRMLKQVSTEQDIRLMYQITPYDVRIMTREMANRETIVRMYDVRDLLVSIPNFDDAPSMSLTDALSNTNSGGGGKGGNNEVNLFPDDDDKKDESKTKAQRAQDLIDLITSTVESDVWRVNGGRYSDIKYLNGILIVRAPLYVHKQIGPSMATTTAAVGSAGPVWSTGTSATPAPKNTNKPNTKSNGVSGTTVSESPTGK